MNEGRIEQHGTPMQVYRYPATRFVADFVGRNNLIDGVIEDGKFHSPFGSTPAGAGSGMPTEGRVTAVIGADALHIVTDDNRSNAFSARLDALEYGGSVVSWFLTGKGGSLTADLTAEESSRQGPEIGSMYDVWWDPNDVHYLPSA
jgi:iron(III) transport system ATP-binding protein